MLPAVSNPPQQKRRVKKTPPKIVLKTWDDAMAYFAKHLKPIAFGPKGQPIYDREDMDALNVQLPVA